MYDLIKNNYIIFAFGLYYSFFVEFTESYNLFKEIFPSEIEIKQNKIKNVIVKKFNNKDSTCYEDLVVFEFSPKGYLIYCGKQYSFTNSNYSERKYEFDKNGILIKEMPYGSEQNDSLIQKYNVKYTNNNRLRESFFQENIFYLNPKVDIREKYLIDKNAREIFRLDSIGRIQEHLAFNVTHHVPGNWYTFFSEKYIYNNIGQLIEILQLDSLKNDQLRFKKTKTFLKYDLNGNLIEISSADFDLKGNIIDTAKYVLKQNYYYNKKNKLVKVTDSNWGSNKGNPEIIYELEHDDFGRIKSKKDNIGYHMFKYNSNGLPILIKSFNNRTMQLEEKTEIDYVFYD